MNIRDNKLVILGTGLASVAAVLALIWGFVCAAHTSEDAFLAHCFLAAVSALVLLPLLLVFFVKRRSSSSG